MDLVIALIVGLVIGALLMWFYLRQQIQAHEARARELQSLSDQKARDLEQWRARAEEAEARAKALSTVAPEPDDLKRIEGIGPKTSKVLNQAGILTFAQLAEAEVDRLVQIVQEAGLRLVDPHTWPEQARLAAAGDWAALDTLQDKLEGGRYV
jgi:predicted flap endonuclease-1-like 5' DNA nuclease